MCSDSSPAACTRGVKPFLTRPILTAPRFHFTNTSSAIKHNDSVEGGKSQLHVAHSIHLSSLDGKKVKTPASHSCLHKSVSHHHSTSLCFFFAPVRLFLIFWHRTEKSSRCGGTEVSPALMFTSEEIETLSLIPFDFNKRKKTFPGFRNGSLTA